VIRKGAPTWQMREPDRKPVQQQQLQLSIGLGQHLAWLRRLGSTLRRLTRGPLLRPWCTLTKPLRTQRLYQVSHIQAHVMRSSPKGPS
jgi:hypothetical protein